MSTQHPDKKRSEVMRRVRSKGSRIEHVVESVLELAEEPFDKHVAGLPGKPDFVLASAPVAIFVDSCFWHGCRLHCRMPKSNVEYWTGKIEYNRRRDAQQRRQLRRSGWLVVRIWEHEIVNLPFLQRKIERAVQRGRGRSPPLPLPP